MVYGEGRIHYTLNNNSAEKIGSTATIKVTISTQNYKDITVNVIVTITDKNTQTLQPDCDMTVTFDEPTGTYTAAITAVEGAEYKFNDGSWSSDNTLTGIAHGTEVTGYIRIAATNEYNAGTVSSMTLTTGHGTLAHHDAVSANCITDGNEEYWTCDSCNILFSDEAGQNAATLDAVTIPATGHSWSGTWSYDETGHWHNCTNANCPITDNTQKNGYAVHTPGAAATETTPQACTECGYVIAPELGHIHSNHLTFVPEAYPSNPPPPLPINKPNAKID